jgi:transposase
MRYADGGGLTALGWSRREQVRLQAAKMFAEDVGARQIARSLRVSTKSVYQWRRAWRVGGEEALASKGPGGNGCRLDEDQLGRLSAALEAGRPPAAGIRISGGRWQPGRFCYRVRGRRLRPGTRRATTEADYAALITAAHRYLQAPVIVIWDNLSTHLSRKMRAFTAGHPNWLTVIQLPAYAPDLNPVEGAWSVMKNSLGNLAPGTTDQLAAAMRHQLDRIQRRSVLINGFLRQAGLTLDPEPP